MQSINLWPFIPGEAVVNQKEKKISITSKQELVYSELLLAVMGISYSVYPLTGYKIYENGEYVAKIKE